MHLPYHIPAWKTAPFIRLILPLMAGILLQWYGDFSVLLSIGTIIFSIVLLLLFRLLKLSTRFIFQSTQGVFIHLLLIAIGSLLTWQKDSRHQTNWYGHFYHDSDCMLVRIGEPLVAKAKSFKAEGYIESIIRSNKTIACKGKLLLYFSKDSGTTGLQYGDMILIKKPLQSIRNSGNPGAFNYQRYAAFQQVFHNVFLKDKDWLQVKEKNINWFEAFIFSARQKILTVLQKNIKGEHDELGVAEALLIGYKEDLDKDLVQAYSNTGVVHIIAISGLHLGLIYIMLLWLFKRIPFVRRSKLCKVLLVLACLWLFSILTGASASVLRSAVMFTCIIIGENFTRKSSIYNSLAVSAFLLLVYNPYFLWDVGFQLSYLAVLGIVLFQRPIYHRCYIKNKWIDQLWQLVAVSLAAQLLTFPICIFYFHQFPNYFLLTNIVTVPLSSIILFAEIFLVAFAWIPSIGIYAGKLITWMVGLMNKIVVWVNELPYAVWDNLTADILSTCLLYAIIIALPFWLMNKSKNAFRFALVGMLCFAATHACREWQTQKQLQIIVYNVPKYPAIDLVKGNQYFFIGDSILQEDGLLQHFHLKPGRIELALTRETQDLPGLYQQGNFFLFCNKRVLLLNKLLLFEPGQQKMNIDIIILSNNCKVTIAQLVKIFNCHQFIFDGSNSLWKIAKWKKEAEELLLRCHSVTEQGAFITAIE